MSYLRAALERGIKTRLKCNASLRIQGQKVLPKPSLQVFSLRWVQSKASQSKVPPKGLSDVQRALKKAPPVKPKGQDGVSKEEAPRYYNQSLYIMGGVVGFIFSIQTVFAGLDKWVAHWESQETNETMATPISRRKFVRERIFNKDGDDNDDDDTPLKMRTFVGLNFKTKSLILQEMEKLRLVPAKNLIFFQADSMEPVMLGYLEEQRRVQIFEKEDLSLFDASLGLPLHLCQDWESAEEVDLSRVRQDDTYMALRTRFPSVFDWTLTLDQEELSKNLTASELRELKETFVLSLAAKSFIVSKKLREMKDQRRKFVELVTGTFPVIAYMVVTVKINDHLKMFQRPLAARLAIYAAVASLMTMTMMVAYTEEEAGLLDRVNRQLKEEGYSEGGVEYLTKQIRRGELLHKGLPSEASRFVTNEGDISKPILTSLHSKETSPSYQLKFFQSNEITTDAD